MNKVGDEMINRWVASRFNVRAEAPGGWLLLYNSMTGALGAIPVEQRHVALDALKHGVTETLDGVLAEMAEEGFLVPAARDEFRAAEELHKKLYADDYLHLILMPSEECNFRCVYCYETFPRDRMEPGVIEGVKRLVADRAPRLKTLVVSWFGGEPLRAADIVGDLSEAFIAVSKEHGFNYVANMTTNGYYLDLAMAEKMVKWQVNKLQITLDGLQEDHDRLRVLADGGGTFERIMDNVMAIRQSSLPLNVILRVNFDPLSLPKIPQLTADLERRVGGDQRFRVFFRPVGKWGGPNDSNLTVCDDRDSQISMLEADSLALEYNLPVFSLEEFSSPFGSVCYAAKPNSFVVGADGTVYKCTVALTNDLNRVGKVHPDGRLELDPEKFALWVTSDDRNDTVCQKCFFRPACQGAACPLIRIETGERPCPAEKRHIKRVMQILYRQYEKFPQREIDGEPMPVS